MTTTTRRLGGAQTTSRTLLLDAAERLLLREGYAAVTSRRVAAEGGMKPQLVHYYFATMDDLFLEVYRRRAEEGIRRFADAIEVHPSLRTVWRFGVARGATTFNLEFVALANHRKGIRDEIAQYARRFREMQLEAITAILTRHDVSPEACPPVVVLMAMTGVSQVMAIEEALGISTGHDEMERFVIDWIDTAERELSPAPGFRTPNRSEKSPSEQTRPKGRRPVPRSNAEPAQQDCVGATGRHSSVTGHIAHVTFGIEVGAQALDVGPVLEQRRHALLDGVADIDEMGGRLAAA